MFHSKLRHAFAAIAMVSALLLLGVREVSAGTRARKERESRNREVSARVESLSPWNWLLALLEKTGDPETGARLDPDGQVVGVQDDEAVSEPGR